LNGIPYKDFINLWDFAAGNNITGKKTRLDWNSCKTKKFVFPAANLFQISI